MAATIEMQTVIKSLKANNFSHVEYADKAADAVPLILDIIPPDASIEMAGSASVMQMGLLDELRRRGNLSTSFPDPEDMRINRKDMLLVSANAVTLDGKLVNTDGMGNRVGPMFFGAKKVVLVISANKIVKNVEEALDRVQHTIAPYHARQLRVNTPCSKTGVCADCNSPQRICNITTIITKKPPSVDFSIFMIGEDLGLGWDPSWPEERKEKIGAAYRVEIDKFLASFPKKS